MALSPLRLQRVAPDPQGLDVVRLERKRFGDGETRLLAVFDDHLGGRQSDTPGKISVNS